MSFLHIVFLLAEFAVKSFDPLGYFGVDTVLLCNLCLTKTKFFTITLRGAGDGGASGLDHSTANYAYFHTVSALRAARVVKSVLVIPLLRLFPIYRTDGFRGEANVTLTADHAYQVGRFLGWYCGECKRRGGDSEPAKVVIGKDTRRSSYMFEYALASGLALLAIIHGRF